MEKVRNMNEELRLYWVDLGRDKYETLKRTTSLMVGIDKRNYVTWYVQAMKNRYYGEWTSDEDEK